MLRKEKPIKIRLIKKSDLNRVAIIFMDAFNKAANKGWTKKRVSEYMQWWYKRRPDLFLVAEVDDRVVGGAVGEIKPLVNGNHLVDLQLFVDIKSQNRGVGKSLLEDLIKKAKKKYKIVEVQGFADQTTKFPMSWYKRIGLNITRWTHIEGEVDEVLKHLDTSMK